MRYFVTKEKNCPPQIKTNPKSWENVVFSTPYFASAERKAAEISYQRKYESELHAETSRECPSVD